MRLLIQGVKEAKVTCNEQVVGAINQGLLVFIGIKVLDTQEQASVLAQKLVSLRLFKDKAEKSNLSSKILIACLGGMALPPHMSDLELNGKTEDVIIYPGSQLVETFPVCEKIQTQLTWLDWILEHLGNKGAIYA